MALDDNTLVCASHLLSRLGESVWFRGLTHENGSHLGKHFYSVMEVRVMEGAVTPYNAAGQPLKPDANLTVYYYGDVRAQQKVRYPFGALKDAFAEAVMRLSLDPAHTDEFVAACRDIIEARDSHLDMQQHRAAAHAL